ncbi:MAG: addiction module protein [Verrucomicrobia bacterium]|nr:addiction module protein [Verrucomicrobiota bacterium]
MATALIQLERQALALPPKARARLVAKLWASLGDAASPLSASWRSEIDRRCREIDDGKIEMIPGDQVFRETRQILQKKRTK